MHSFLFQLEEVTSGLHSYRMGSIYLQFASCRGLGQRDPNHLEVPQNPTLTRDLEDIMLITQEEQEGPRKQRA